MSGQWHGGKGSNPRPISISQEEYDTRWDAIFQRDIPNEDNTGVTKNEFQDVLSTEDCFDVDERLTRYNEETQHAKKLINRP